MAITTKTFRQLLRARRHALLLTQQGAAAAAAVPLTTWRDWEMEKHLPGILHAQQIAKVLGVCVADLAHAARNSQRVYYPGEVINNVEKRIEAGHAGHP